MIKQACLAASLLALIPALAAAEDEPVPLRLLASSVSGAGVAPMIAPCERTAGVKATARQQPDRKGGG